VFVSYFQVGVEIRDELHLIEPSEVKHDISREVSKKRRMIDTIRDLGVIISHRHISVFQIFSIPLSMYSFLTLNILLT